MHAVSYWFQTKVQRGASSGLFVSLLIHLALLLGAASWVVIRRMPRVYVDPVQVVMQERLRMPLPPPVRIMKVEPPLVVNRIEVTPNPKLAAPEVVLPGLSRESIWSVDIPTFGVDIGPFSTEMGKVMPTGNDFVGRFYDLKRRRDGTAAIMDPSLFKDVVAKFVRGGWNSADLAKYYRSPKELYATHFMVPTMRSSVAPRAFGEDTGGWCWLAHYKGTLEHPEAIRFRFWGQGDDILIVRVDDELVLNASWPGTEPVYSNWQSKAPRTRQYRLGSSGSVVGDWIELRAGESRKMEVLCGEVPGGNFDMMLLVEVEGVDYPLNAQQGPILPLFKKEPLGADELDRIYEWLVPEEADPLGGPVFSMIQLNSPTNARLPRAESLRQPAVAMSEMRLWTLGNGRQLEGKPIQVIGRKLVLQTVDGKMAKLPLEKLAAAERTYVELWQEPAFTMSFIKQSRQRQIQTTPYLDEAPPRLLEYTFGAKLKQTSATPYAHQVSIELFAIGQQYLDDEIYCLLDRQRSHFVPAMAEGRAHRFTGQPVELQSYELNDQTRGLKHMGYLLLVRDLRGKVIQAEASNDWLYERAEQIAALEVGHFFDRSGSRVRPSGPKRHY
jgi:hypothetical protein